MNLPCVFTFAIDMVNLCVARGICVSGQNQVIEIDWKDLCETFPASRGKSVDCFRDVRPRIGVRVRAGGKFVQQPFVWVLAATHENQVLQCVGCVSSALLLNYAGILT
jgi:hypothetical protein